jgi:O-antigen/teichoic acid export membrane protein
VLVVIAFEGGLKWLVLGLLGGPLVAALMNNLLFFGVIEPGFMPAAKLVSRKEIARIAHTGLLFLVLQVVAAIAYSSDNLVIAQMLGASAVAEYAVPERMFSLITTVLATFLSPLWPAYGEAMARGDHSWVKRTFKRSLLTALCVSAVLSTILVVFGTRIIALWVGHAVDPPMLLLLGFGLWKVIEAGGNALAVFLNGTNVIKLQIVVAVATAAGAIVLKILLVGHMGVAGPVWASIISYTLLCALPLAVMLPNLLK